MKPAWVAVLADGGVLVEGEGRTWDDVPPGSRVRSLQIRDLDGGATLVSLDGFARCYAANEAVAAPGRQGVPSAKVIGAVFSDGTVREARIDFAWSSLTRSEPTVPAAALRSGVEG